MSIFPEDIYFEILLKVPVKSLFACKCVCKTWFILISSSDFVKMHLNGTNKRNYPSLFLKGVDNRTGRDWNGIMIISHNRFESFLSTDRFRDCVVEIDYPFKSYGYSVQLMGCCDGLVCLWYHNRHFFCLWNPATREYKKLPNPNIDDVDMFAFGCDYKRDDYKLLVGTELSFEVYSLGSNSWRTIGEIPYEFGLGTSKPSAGVFVNGDFHCFADKIDSSNEDADDEDASVEVPCNYVVVSLNISNETFKEIELPKEPFEKEFLGKLGALEECLCFWVVNKDAYMDIWVMQNYGIGESWSKRYTVSTDWRGHFMNSEILYAGAYNGLFLHFSEDDMVINRNTSSLEHLYVEECYFESLVPLNSGTYSRRRTYRRIKNRPRLGRVTSIDSK